MSEYVIVNRDRVDSSFAQYEHNANITTYGASDRAEYWIEADDIYGPHGTPIEIRGPEYSVPLHTNAQLVGTNALLAALAGAVVATKLGINEASIAKGISRIATLPGRMNPLHGIGQTLILDDTYRAHPDAAIAGLQALYEFDTAPQRIAILSSFPDLAQLSADEHKRVGALCNPDLLAWVIVVGEDAKTHLAPAARKRGCQVKVCNDAIEAAQFARSVTEHGAVILVEGSSKETYLEETTKILCDVSEESKLVRQGGPWRAIKNEHFSRFK
jgi:UDP-N-acetylmuramoyl-tripeptide--D-alanyl-D-alanine ligase